MIVAKLRPGIEVVASDDGQVVLDTRRGVYWHLNDAAIALLQHLGEGKSLDEHVAGVAQRTGADQARVRADYLYLVDELRHEKLIEGDVP